MERSELQTLSSSRLQRLIAEAAEVLAERAGSSSGTSGGSQVGQTGKQLFTFGQTSSESHSRPNLFSQTGGLFSSSASSGGLFGAGSFACDWTDQGTQQSKAALFSPEARVDGTEKSTGAGSGRKEPEGGNGDKGKVADNAAEGGVEEEGEEGEECEEVTSVPGWTAPITLEVCSSIETGEEQEQELYCQRSKLYRFRDGEWKERGLGEARLLKHKTTGTVRFLLRQDKTGKVAANFFVIDRKPYCDLRPNSGSDKIWVWCAQDYSDGEACVEEFALRFGNAKLAAGFKEAFEDAKKQNSLTQSLAEGTGTATESKDSSEKD